MGYRAKITIVRDAVHRLVGDDDSHNLPDPERPIRVDLKREREIEDDPGMEFYCNVPVFFPDLDHPPFHQAASRLPVAGDCRQPDLPPGRF